MDSCFNSSEIKCVKSLANVKEKYMLRASLAIYGGVIRKQMHVETEVQMSPGVSHALSLTNRMKLRYKGTEILGCMITAGTREKDRGPTHMSDVSASESLKGIHKPDP